MRKLPIVALIGQTNAGKSSLLNRLAKKHLAITAREEGTTRDNVIANINNQFLLIDTAGLKNPEDDFEKQIQSQINDAIDQADLILLTLDSTKYPNHIDKQIAKNALRSKKPVLLLLNKSDQGASLPLSEFLFLGINQNLTFKTSATTGSGIQQLLSTISTLLPSPTSTPQTKPALTLALIGRPNVGKSSLFNNLGQKQQAIVSSKQGTTRDINRLNLKYKNQTIHILDTAGLRKPGRREVGIEKFSALKTLSAIEESDICALIIDATEPHAKLDQALAGEIIKAGKGIILVVNKTDLTSDTDQILNRLEQDFNFLPYVPVLLTSATTGKNTAKLFELVYQIYQNRQQIIPTSKLNLILAEALNEHPPAGLKNTHPKPKYIVQTDSNPPWFVVHGHELQLLHWSYKRFLEKKIRQHFNFTGTPIFFSFKSTPKK